MSLLAVVVQTFKTLMVKAVGAMFSIGSGLVAGKEGPFIQCGACIAALVLQLKYQMNNWLSNRSTTRTTSSPSSSSNGSCKRRQNQAAHSRGSLPTTVVDAEAAGKDPTRAHQAATASVAQHSFSQQGLQPISASTSVIEQDQQQAQQLPSAARVSQVQAEGAAAADAAWWEEQQKLRRRQQHDQAAMGAGAGVAAAFVAPLAGAAYSIEEATSIYSGTMFTQVTRLADGSCLLLQCSALHNTGRSPNLLASV